MASYDLNVLFFKRNEHNRLEESCYREFKLSAGGKATVKNIIDCISSNLRPFDSNEIAQIDKLLRYYAESISVQKLLDIKIDRIFEDYFTQKPNYTLMLPHLIDVKIQRKND